MCMITAQNTCYFPAIIRGVYYSPIDALLWLCVPHDEAMSLVEASWRANVGLQKAPLSIVASVDGGRAVAAVYLGALQWAACNAFLEPVCRTRVEAERRLQKLVKGARRGCVGVCEVA